MSKEKWKQEKRVHFVDCCDDGIRDKVCPILEQHFTLIFDSVNPEYVFYSAYGEEHLAYDCIRIFITGENITPNFTICDYAIGFDHLHFLDRYLRYPLYLFYEADVQTAAKKHESITQSTLKSKSRFCNFVVSNGNADPYREQVFYALNAYKRVDSGGRYLNNIGGSVADKFAFQSECRFSLCFENSSTPGYLTEKLIQAAAAQTIPIYWGDTLATKPLCDGGGINAKAFINAHSFSSLESLIAHIAEIEADKTKQLAILQEPLFLDSNHIELFEKQLEQFLLAIFSQPYERSFRRGRVMWQSFVEQRYKRAMHLLALEDRIKAPYRKLRQFLRAFWDSLKEKRSHT